MTSKKTPDMHTHFAHIKGIDVLRGFAALIVVFSHYIPFWNDDLSPVPIIISSEIGHYSVELFFVISGIVIFATLNKCNSTVHFFI